MPLKGLQAGWYVLAKLVSYSCLNVISQISHTIYIFFSLIGCQVHASNVNTCQLKWHMNNITGDTLKLSFHEDACQ